MASRALAQRSTAIKPNPKQDNYDDIYNVYEKHNVLMLLSLYIYVSFFCLLFFLPIFGK